MRPVIPLGAARAGRTRPLLRLWPAVGLLLLLLVGCNVRIGPAALPSGQAEPKLATLTANAAADGSQQAQVQLQPHGYPALLNFTSPHAQVGETVDVQGSGYPADAEVELVWYSVQGRYELEGGTEFVGQRYDELSRVLLKVRADHSGNIRTKLQVPLDYGGPHDVRGRVAGQELSQAVLTIEPTFSLSPREGPVGTLVELTIVGVDSRPNVNTWQVLYDNHYLGFMSGVQTKGVATARFRAAGPIGTHRISAWHNSFNSIPYLNFQQGPYKEVPGAELTFQVTSDLVTPASEVEDFSARDGPWPTESAGPGRLSLSVDRGVVGQSTTLSGSSLPPNATLALRWWTMIGNRVSPIGFSRDRRSLGQVQTGSDGAFSVEMAIPDDLGGQHRLEVLDGDRVLAATGMVIQPSLVSIAPTRVRVGEQIKIRLKGLGWTTYDNTYAVTYDNSYIGYVCGFSTNGDVELSITATGWPGTHIIDLYPTVYKGRDAVPHIYSVPQLTYANDHPQRTTPAMRLAIEVTE